MTNEELLNIFTGQAMQALLQKDGLAADKERICKNAWMIACMMLNAKKTLRSNLTKWMLLLEKSMKLIGRF